ncbi:MAG TPA: hypothetical protein VE978_03240 [Chitinophagales bacterium]|nr:hypothetical protein [Chitinophagales bacterium]
MKNCLLNYFQFLLPAIFLLTSENLFAQEASDSAQATIQLSFNDRDTVRQVTAKIVRMSADGKETPVKDVEIHFYIARMYSLLPVGGDVQTTDESGSVTIDFPKDLPGDSEGNLTVIAKVEDDDALGNLESEKILKWGVPVANKALTKRALWASGANAPIPLVIAVTSMLLLVWGVIIYIVAQLFRIKKLGRV